MLADKHNIEKLVHFLSCPQCGSDEFKIKTAQLQCNGCLISYPIVEGKPIFTQNAEETKIMSLEHISNQPPEKLVNWLKELNGCSLNIGAGSTETKIPNCIELEYSIHRNTDVVADAHRLPFKNEVFDAVVSFNTFEHLHDPTTAAREIFRVLKPGGKVVIHTAFLQPLHEEPHHYYNATKYGILNWFSEFDVDKCAVLERFNPALTVGWLSCEILHFVSSYFGMEIGGKLAQTKLEDWSRLWLDEQNRNGFVWDTLINLPQNIQERYAAGFEVELTKPITLSSLQEQSVNNSESHLRQLPIQYKSINLELPSVENSKSLQAIEQKRALAIARLRAAKMCEVMGKEPWSLIPNAAYNQCENPCISVIVTLYNYSEYIYECLDSVSKSELSDLPSQIEVLVVDDCSSDRSASMVEEYMAKSPLPICLIKKSFNTGLADARNVGLKVARAPYVFILDADNWIHPNCLSILYQTIKSSVYAGVYSLIRRFNHETKEEIGLVSSEEWNVQKLVDCPYIDAMAMFDREILMKVGGYSTELIEYGWFGWEDYDLWLKLAQDKHSCKLVSKVLSSYRVHPTSMINSTNYYTLTIAKYFSNKFADVVKNYSKSDKLFGFEQNEIFCLPKTEEKPEEKLAETEQQLAQTEQRLHELQQEIEKQSNELQQAYTTIAAIQSSKFWQVRNNWFKFKKLLGLADGTEVKI